MDSGKELNYWPAFVDALSNVVLTLVFVLVVFVFGLVLASGKMSQKTKEMAELARDREIQRTVADSDRVAAESEMQDLRRELRDALTRLQTVSRENDKLHKQIDALKREQVVGSEEMNILKEKVQIRVDGKARSAEGLGEAEADLGSGVIVITFPRGVFELSDKVRADLDKALSGLAGRLAGAQAWVSSVPGDETFSEARRLAYYRGLTVRNYLIDKGLGSGRTISIQIERDKEVGDGRVEIRFRRR